MLFFFLFVLKNIFSTLFETLFLLCNNLLPHILAINEKHILVAMNERGCFEAMISEFSYDYISYIYNILIF